MNLRIRAIWILAVLIVTALLAVGFTSAAPVPVRAETIAPPTGGGPVVLHGHASVLGGPLARAKIKLHRAGLDNRAPALLSEARSDHRGRFHLNVPGGVQKSDVLYLTARGGSRVTSRGVRRRVPKQLKLATLVGQARPGRVTLNERTTAASGFAAAQFLKRDKLQGKSPGLPNAASMSQNLVNIKTGEIATFLNRRPNGNRTSAKATLNSLSNTVSACAKSARKCRALLQSANAGSGPHPTSSWQALADTARYPSYRAARLFRIQKRTQTFTPALASAPKAWTVALKFVGNRKQFDGPGNVAIDVDGNVWANNNYTKSKDPTKICGSKNIFKLHPYEKGAPVATYSGGGLDGAGFGIGIDPKGHVWVGNFGFMGRKCTSPPTSNSVSEFRPNGKPKSGPDGYTEDVSWPQATVSDRDGNIWIANCKTGAVVKYPKGNPAHSQVVGTDVAEAFGIALDRGGNAWSTAAAGNKVFAFRQDGTQLPGSPYTHPSLDIPMGIAADSRGNIWVANQGFSAPPCDAGETDKKMALPPSGVHGKITRLDEHGNGRGFSGGGLTAPWDIAVDGDDNVWVANFQGQRISHFCGARPATCPKGKTTGDGISPGNGGYGFEGLQRNTGMGIDPSGNLWVTNNWKNKPVQINPGGNGLVVFVGLASPVKTPSIGVPVKP